MVSENTRVSKPGENRGTMRGSGGSGIHETVEQIEHNRIFQCELSWDSGPFFLSFFFFAWGGKVGLSPAKLRDYSYIFAWE